MTAEKEKNRARFPKCAAMLDAFRREFGEGVKMRAAIEGDSRVGPEAELAKLDALLKEAQS